MLRRVPQLLAFALALAIPMAACESVTDTRTGGVTILLTDAPGELEQAWVTITDIYLQGQAGEEDPPQSRVYLLENGDETHELLSLANTVTELVSNVPVPAGTYGQLRIVISNACVLTEDGDAFSSSPAYGECGTPTGTLQIPSFAQTGAKVLLHGLEVTGGDQAILLDFHVEDSFKAPAPPANQWIMTPVIHGAEVSFSVGVTATLSLGDDVELPEGVELGAFSATLTPDEGDESTLFFEESDGDFQVQFRFLLPDNGPFEVALNAPEGVTVVVSPESPQEVSPASGQTATIDWTLESIEVEDDDDEDDDDEEDEG